MNYIAPNYKFGLLALAVATLTACGGGSGTASSTQGTPVAIAVMDGLISNALVCVDANNNGACDTGEIQGRTDTTGNVTLTVSAEQLNKSRLVAMVGTDAVDLDNGPVTKAYTLQTPAGKHKVISPLTTMVQAAMDSDDIGTDTAAKQVETQLGMTVSVFDDFIAMRGTSPAHKKAALIARVLTVAQNKSRDSNESCDDSDSNEDKESHVHKNLLTTLAAIKASSSVISDMACASGNAATDCASTIQAMAPKVSHCAVPLTAQTITFAAPTGAVAGGSTTLAATASSGLTVSYATTTPTVCSISGSALSFLTAGTCTVKTTQAGDKTFAPATAVSQSFAVAAAPVTPGATTQTISFAAPGTQTLGSVAPMLVATSSSGLPVALTSSTTAVCSVSGTTLNLMAAGTCTVNANQAGGTVSGTTYAAAPPKSGSFTVLGRPQTIAFTAPASATVPAPVTLTASASSGLAVTFAAAPATTCTVNGSTLTPVAMGTCTITATQTGNTGYAAATAVVSTVPVLAAAPSAQTISFAGPGAATAGTPVTLSATSSSGLAVTFTASPAATCTVSASTLTPVAAGTCTITANQTGNASYAAATAVTRTVTVAAGGPTAWDLGKAAYAKAGLSCASCHGANPANNTAKILSGANNAAKIQSAITNNTGGMGSMASIYTAAEIQSVATYLAGPTF